MSIGPGRAGAYRKLTDAERAKMVRLWREGTPQAALAERFNVSLRTVGTVCKAAGREGDGLATAAPTHRGPRTYIYLSRSRRMS